MTNERNCENCAHARPFGGENDNRCDAWECEFIDRKEAIEAYKARILEAEKMVLYICDRRKCEDCHDDCHLTRDIDHAVMFYKNGQGDYVERIMIPKEIHKDKLLEELLIKELRELKAEE